MTPTKFIYFDIGGVLVLDFSGTNKWTQLKLDLGVFKKRDDEFESVWQKYEPRINLDLDIDTILNDFEEAAGVKFPHHYSMLEDMVNRFDKNLSLWPIVNKTRKKYKIGLLTNMYPRMLTMIQSKGLLPASKWDAVIDSSKVGFQKPDPAIYQIAEGLVGVKPSEIFFIDNKSENLETAKQRGWQIMLYNPQQLIKSNNQLQKALDLK